MITYQDFLAVPADNEAARAEFVKKVINNHKDSAAYRTAKTAEEYDCCRNTTILQYQRMITTVTGQKVPDNQNAMHRSTSNFFNIFTTQLNQYLLGNGVIWKGDAEKALGTDFDTRLQEIGKSALVDGQAFGYFNLDHVEVFKLTNFAPLYDEVDGALAAGVRFWQIDETKPLRATLYEMDGVTNFLWITKDRTVNLDKKWRPVAQDTYVMDRVPYKMTKVTTEADGVELYKGENYPAFPIVPMWGNPHHQSELVGMQEKIDAYDFILNGFEDDLDNAELYWIIKGAGGMDDVDLRDFLSRLRNVKAAAPADGQEVEAVSVEIPYEARERLLDRLEKQLYRDAMIMNPDDLASGAATATQIRAAYERQNVKADQFEYCVIEFITGILRIAGVEDEPTFTRSTIVNVQEEIQTVVMAAAYLGSEYTTRKILTLLGDGDQADEIIKQVDAENMDRLGSITDEEDEKTEAGEGERGE